jgi:parallel beta-helix repeat protein
MFSALRLAAAGSILVLVGALGATGILGPQFQLVTDHTITVAQDGSGDVPTITEALVMAVDGDTIEVMPGTYPESLAIASNVTLMGVGDPGAVVLDSTASTAMTTAYGDESWPYGMLLQGSDAVVSDLTIRGPVPGIAVGIDGGAPTISRLAIDIPSDGSLTDGDTSFLIVGGSTATISDSDWSGYVKINKSSPTITGNTIAIDGISVDFPESQPIVRGNTLGRGGWIGFSYGSGGLVEDNVLEGGDIGVDTGADPVIRGNTLRGSADGDCGSCRPSAIYVKAYAWDHAGEGVSGTGLDTLAPVIEGNDISGRGTGVDIAGDGAEPTVSGNTIHDNDTGISTGSRSAATITGNTLVDNGVGVLSSSSASTVNGNVVRGGTTGILASGSDVVLDTNTVEGSGTGFALEDTVTQLRGNAACGNGVDIRVGGDPVATSDGITICPDGPPASATP